ncbi:hypothetical protein LTR70_004585 [Exophiala xenobiotica]|nr:hypothetical protein LTR70_004585 [Exophiala xenobiotica]
MAAMKRVFQGFWQSAESPDKTSLSSSSKPSHSEDPLIYDNRAEEIRQAEYPTLLGTTYLDHAGTTPYTKTAIERWTAELTTNLFGNPHSASASSQLSTRRIDDIRLKVLKFFNANPEDFDVVFVANATAAIKLVAEACCDGPEGFWYGYHGDAHTSLVGCRELATQGTSCFEDDRSVESWISSLGDSSLYRGPLQLFAYPGQSNMTGRRLPFEWCSMIRAAAAKNQQRVYTLLDAASLVSTSPLDLSDPSTAPDFTAFSFYKIFGFPDLGALIVRRESGSILTRKRYFGGGTVDAVISSESSWHAKKGTLHGALEEGTLPFHNIVALDHAMAVHEELFGSMKQVASHTRFLARAARRTLRGLVHANRAEVCEIYGPIDTYDCGPLVAFNLKDSTGKILSAYQVEKLCTVKYIQLRTGSLCNPGGIARHLGLLPEHVRHNYDVGWRCGGENDMINGMPTGVIRISFGAMSTKSDLETFISFIEEYYVERHLLRTLPTPPVKRANADSRGPGFFIESLSVFPIKSCAAFQIPAGQKWHVRANGLAWDREWCLVHEGTNVALSQKRYPCMALLQPEIDLETQKLRVSYAAQRVDEHIEIDLQETPSTTIVPAKTCSQDIFRLQDSKVCGDTIPLHVYTSATVNKFFSEVLGVPCCLARYPRSGSPRNVNIRKPERATASPVASAQPSSMKLANESPLLVVSRSSVNELNRQIRHNARERGADERISVSASSFRANIVVAERKEEIADGEMPYSEDSWTAVSISPNSPIHNTLKGREVSLDAKSHAATVTTTVTHKSDTTSSNSNSNSSNPSLPGSFDTSTSTSTSRTRWRRRWRAILLSSRTSTSASTGTSISSLSHSHSQSPKSPPPPPPPPPQSEPLPQPLTLTILGPCQRCQMVGIDQATARSQQEPFSTLAKTRRKGDGRVWFGVHAALDMGLEGEGERYVRVGDLVWPG